MNTQSPAHRILFLLVLALLLLPVAARAAEPADPYATAATPGAEHRLLATLAGSFQLTSTFWPDPAAPPVISQLPARRELILGGRAVRLEVGPGARGFRGTGLLGFDNGTGSYWYVWTDTTTTGVSRLEGALDERGTGVFEGLMPTPFGLTPLRVEVRHEGEEEIHDYFLPQPDGAAVRMLELRYRPAGTF